MIGFLVHISSRHYILGEDIVYYYSMALEKNNSWKFLSS